MSGDRPAVSPDGQQDSRNLVMRVLAAAVLAPLAIVLAAAGGWLWAALVIAAAAAIYIEWLLIVGAAQARHLVLGLAALLIAGSCLALGRAGAAAAVCAIGVIAVSGLARDKQLWAGGGLLYAAAAMLAAMLVRRDVEWGFAALMFVLAVVWATDIGGYFAGRGIGGPKLWVRVSPKKTWAGAAGSLLGSLIVAAGFAASGVGRMTPLLALAAALSVVSQFGDLFESAVKRRFGVKDSSNIIPGHGGVMDRLDGFVAAIVAAAAIGIIRGGVDGVARGLVVW